MRASKSPTISNNNTTNHPQTQCFKEKETTHHDKISQIATIINSFSKEYQATLSTKSQPQKPDHHGGQNGLKHWASPEITLTVYEYSIGLTRALEVDLRVLVVAFILISRFLRAIKDNSCNKPLPPINFYKMVAVSLFCAQKLALERDHIGIQDFAIISRLSVQELGEMEIEFLEEIDFRLHVTKEEF